MLRARLPLDAKAGAAADAAMHDRTEPPGRALDPASTEDAPLRAAWMQAYAEAGGAVETAAPGAVVGSPTLPCAHFIELRYLHCDGSAVKQANFHIRAAGYSKDGQLDGNGFVHLAGVPPVGGFSYWFDKDPETYVPAGPKLASQSPAVTAGAISAVDDVLDWLWGTAQGDFNKDASLGQIAVNTVLGLIPVVDQALDVRDLISGLKDVIGFYMEDTSEQNAHEEVLGLSYEAWLWLALFLIAIGCIPEVGSAVKGVAKGLIKLLQDASKKAGDLSPAQLRRIWEELLKVLNHFGVKPGNAHEWLKKLPAQLGGWMDQAAVKIKGAMDALAGMMSRAERVAGMFGSEKAAQAIERLRRARAALAHAYGRLDAMKRRINDWLREQFERVLGGKHHVESGGGIDAKAGHEGANVRTQEKVAPGEPTIPPERPHRTTSYRVNGEPDAERVKALSFNHEQRKTDLAEGLGGARYERATGARLTKSDIDGADLVDPSRGPLSLKGPLVDKKSGTALTIDDRMVEGLAKSVAKDVQFNSATQTVVVDTLGMSNAQREALKRSIADRLSTLDGALTKDIVFLE